MISSRSLLLAQLALIVALAWTVVYLGRDEIRDWFHDAPEQAPPARTAADRDGGPDVQVSEALQKASGLRAEPLAEHRLLPSLPVQGVVADLRPLAQQVASLRSAVAEEQAARATAARYIAEHRRVLALYEDDRNVSERALHAAEAERRAAEGRLAAAEAGAAAARETLRLEWGDTLARWAETGGNSRPC